MAGPSRGIAKIVGEPGDVATSSEPVVMGELMEAMPHDGQWRIVRWARPAQLPLSKT